VAATAFLVLRVAVNWREFKSTTASLGKVKVIEELLEAVSPLSGTMRTEFLSIPAPRALT
jgi:hypothetical protein